MSVPAPPLIPPGTETRLRLTEAGFLFLEDVTLGAVAAPINVWDY
jgi:hypothetical protein